MVKTTGGDLALARSSVIDARRRVISLPSAIQVFSLDPGILVPEGDQPLLDLLFREVLRGGSWDFMLSGSMSTIFTRNMKVKLFLVTSP